MKFALFILFNLYIQESFARKELCEQFTFIACPSAFAASRSNTNASVPSNAASGAANPASMTVDRGFGVEALNFGSWWDVNIVAGTGVIGSGFSTSNSEGTFFGNTTQETNQDYENRIKAGHKFKSQKVNTIFAFSLIGGGKKRRRRKGLKLNIGVMGRYNKPSKNFHPGFGVTLSWFNLSAGIARLRDDAWIADRGVSEQFYTSSFSVGYRFANLAVDWNYLRNSYRNFSRVSIVSGSFFAKKFVITYGVRKEDSKFRRFNYASGVFDERDRTTIQKNSGFLGFQYIAKKKLILGLFSNYYLQREISLGATFFL